MQFTNRRRRGAPSIIIVSLIDVLLVVLIFLMVSTTFKKQPTVKVNLPTTKLAKEGTGDGPVPFILTITKDPPYLHLESGAVTLERLKQIVAEQVAKNPNLKASIRADGDVPLKEILKVSEVFQELHFKETPGMFVLPEGKQQ